MRLAIVASVVLLAVSAHAAPAANASGDDLDKLLADKGLIGRLDQVRQQVRDKTSELVVNAMGFLGVPYKRGGNSAETGFDCSGFVRAMYEQTVGLVLPRKAEQQAAATDKIDQKELQPGDLVFFNTMRKAFSHVGIYVGDGKFIHSPRSGAQVRVEDMRTSYWARRFDGARRVAGQGDSAAPQAAALVADTANGLPTMSQTMFAPQALAIPGQAAAPTMASPAPQRASKGPGADWLP